MPAYDFMCPNGHIVEEFYPMQDAPLTIRCPRCGEKAKRLLNSPTVVGAMKDAKNFKNLEYPLGRKFESTKEVDAFLKQKGIERL